MNRLRVACVVGTRPEVIKMAPVVRALRERPQLFEPVVVATAQHRDLLDQMLGLFDVSPDVDLDLMEFNQSPVRLMARVLGTIEAVFQQIAPDLVLVQGDTVSAMAVSTAAFLTRIPVGHVEAGLRSFDKGGPFPEEISRRVTSLVADWHFAPTTRARANLLREGVAPNTVYVTGNTVVDAVLAIAHAPPPLDVPPGCELDPGHKLLLVTTHRRESHGEPLRRICRAIHQLVERNDDVEIVLPVHPNPNVTATVDALLAGRPRIHLVAPLEYATMIHLMNRSHLILTDSGGVQEEAPSLSKPVLILRDVTERPEGVEAGVARLVGTASEVIVREAEQLLTNPEAYARMTQRNNPYGDGRAATRIADIIATSCAPLGQSVHV
jgi:UDP-N-acetylglucosamine 2-epimerase (non-hydrolysing)